MFDCRAEDSEQEATCWSFVRRSCDRLRVVNLDPADSQCEGYLSSEIMECVI